MCEKRFAAVELTTYGGADDGKVEWGVMDEDNGELVVVCDDKANAVRCAFCYNWKQRRLDAVK